VAVPFSYGVGGPLSRFGRLRVTVVASVRRAERDRKIRPRDAKTVIPPGIDHHVSSSWHVARDAFGARGADRMMEVVGRVVYLRLVTLRAQLVAGQFWLEGVRIMAIGAANAFG